MTEPISNRTSAKELFAEFISLLEVEEVETVISMTRYMLDAKECQKFAEVSAIFKDGILHQAIFEETVRTVRGKR